MTGNQKFAKMILGFLPMGYVCVIEHRGIGSILVDGKTICQFKMVPSDYSFN